MQTSYFLHLFNLMLYKKIFWLTKGWKCACQKFCTQMLSPTVKLSSFILTSKIYNINLSSFERLSENCELCLTFGNILHTYIEQYITYSILHRYIRSSQRADLSPLCNTSIYFKCAKLFSCNFTMQYDQDTSALKIC